MATQTVVATLRTTLTINETLTTGLASGNYSTSLIPSLEFEAGATNAANSINQIYCKAGSAVTLNSGANTTYTLTALTDEAGRAISFANGVRGLMIYVTSRSAGDYLNVGGAASNAWTGLVNTNGAVLRVYDFAAFGVMNTDKYAVANGSSEQVKITNAGSNAITFKLAVWGNT
jgi:hypothetical protein